MKSLLRALTDALDKRQPFLTDKIGLLSEVPEVQNIQRSINQLIDDTVEKSQKERDTSQLIKTTLGSIQEAVFIVDDENRVILTNVVAQNLFASNEVDLVGRHFEGIIHSSQLMEYISEVREKGMLPAVEMAVVIKEKHFCFQVSAATLENFEKDKGHLTLLALYDITRLKRLEEIRREFVANVSHELRTPISIIKGFMDTLVEDHAKIEVKMRSQFLERIRKNVIRLHLLVEDLLTLSRIESQPQSFINRETCSLNQLFTDIHDNYNTLYGAEGPKIELNLDVSDDQVVVDPLWITQVAENLLDNIRRYAKGATQIIIETRSEGKWIHCKVEDNGCGIPEKSLPSIFERFYRVEKDRSRESGGTGLGLSIVKHIIQQHGGDVFAKSIEGEGTQICFSLPKEN